MKQVVLISVFIFLGFVNSKAQMKPGWVFHDELLKGLESPKDTIYIQDRKKLEKFAGVHIFNDSVLINYKTKTGDRFYVFLESIDFIPSKHIFSLPDTVYQVINGKKEWERVKCSDSIDNRKAYGFVINAPKKEIKSIKIKWNKIWLAIPRNAYSNLYEPDLNIAAYISQNRKLLYVYMNGSDGAGSYSVKFVFNKNKYAARLITTNECVDGFDFLDATSADCE